MKKQFFPDWSKLTPESAAAELPKLLAKAETSLRVFTQELILTKRTVISATSPRTIPFGLLTQVTAETFFSVKSASLFV